MSDIAFNDQNLKILALEIINTEFTEAEKITLRENLNDIFKIVENKKKSFIEKNGDGACPSPYVTLQVAMIENGISDDLQSKIMSILHLKSSENGQGGGGIAFGIAALPVTIPCGAIVTACGILVAIAGALDFFSKVEQVNTSTNIVTGNEEPVFMNATQKIATAIMNAGEEIVKKPFQGGKKYKKSVPKSSPVKTARSHKCKDGVVRKLYKKGENFFVKMKSKETGKFIFKKVKV